MNIEGSDQQQPITVFKQLLPGKIVNCWCDQLNRKLRGMFVGQLSEKEIKKKLFKNDQLYEYLGVKLLMGYIRMPDYEDYFNQTTAFRNKIGDMIKEGRFKCLETLTEFDDDILKPKQSQASSEIIIPRIMKKINKVMAKVAQQSQSIGLIRNPYFDVLNQQGQSVSCIYLMNIETQFILKMNFQTTTHIQDVAQQYIQPLKNHKLYFSKNFFQIDDIAQMVSDGLCPHGVIQSDQDPESLPFQTVKHPNPDLLIVSTKDPIQQQGSKTSICLESITRAEQFAHSSDQYRCQFSLNTLSGAILTEVLELITWNTYILTRKTNQDYLDFRVELAKQFLSQKIKALDQNPYPQLPLKIPQTVIARCQTDQLHSYTISSRPALSRFHCPIPLLNNAHKCLVCDTDSQLLLQCPNCTDVSHKVVSLCQDCFGKFHLAPRQYIQKADDYHGEPPTRPIQTAPEPKQIIIRNVLRAEDSQFLYQQSQLDEDLFDDGAMKIKTVRRRATKVEDGMDRPKRMRESVF